MSLSSRNPAEVARTLYHNLPRPGESFITNEARWKLVQVFASSLLNGELYPYPDEPKHPDYALYKDVCHMAEICASGRTPRGGLFAMQVDAARREGESRAVSVRVDYSANEDGSVSESLTPLDAIDELRDAVSREEN